MLISITLISGPCKCFKRAFSLHDLSSEHKELQKLCRTFAEKNLKPIAGDLDRNNKFVYNFC